MNCHLNRSEMYHWAVNDWLLKLSPDITILLLLLNKKRRKVWALSQVIYLLMVMIINYGKITAEFREGRNQSHTKSHTKEGRNQKSSSFTEKENYDKFKLRNYLIAGQKLISPCNNRDRIQVLFPISVFYSLHQI